MQQNAEGRGRVCLTVGVEGTLSREKDFSMHQARYKVYAIYSKFLGNETQSQAVIKKFQ